MTTETHTLSDELSAIDYCYEQGWTDGLPVVPPARERVERFLMAAGRPPEEIVARHPATGRECNVQSAAVNAVMAGCLPQYFPTVLAALEGLNEDEYNFHGSTASTGGSAPAVIVSGDIRDEIGMNASVNVFGSGNRANATIGRAIRLVIMNIFHMIPGISDRSTTGWPGKYSCCIAENILNSPWEPLHESLGFPPEVSTATVFAASGFYNVENHYTSDPERLLDTFADAMASLGALTDGQSLVVMSPEHAQIAASGGMSKQDVQEYLFEHSYRMGSDMRDAGKWPSDRSQDGLAPAIDGRGPARTDDVRFHRGREPEDILIVVAGGEAGGHSAFLPSWSRGRGSLFQTKAIGVCLDC
ncbi:MAG: hypothetical protein F4Z38_04200 [Chloroflexi bacterium]|nr:hypothetical protein [Chloroflexota bacterium]